MKLCAYHSYSDPYEFPDHLTEMQERGFDSILFAVSEEQWKFNLDNVRLMREHADAAGMDTWAGPWGLSGMFGGEAISTKRPGPDGDVWFEMWKNDMITRAGFRTIFLDEPQIDDDPAVMCDWFAEQRLTTMPDIRLTTSLADDTFRGMTDEQLRTLPVDSLGLSCYHWTTDEVKVWARSEDWISRLTRIRTHDSHVWIQLFDLPEGSEWIPGLVREIAEYNGVTDLAYWSFRAARATSVKRAYNWEKVWRNVG